MKNSLEKDFNFTGLLRFTFPTIIMMVFTATYSIVDGFFVARFVGTDALSSINIAFPLFNAVLAIGVMIGAGGSALIAKKMGEGKSQEAKENFTLLVATCFVIGVILMVAGGLSMEALMRFLGADEVLLPGCMTYGYLLLPFTIPTLLQMAFQYWFVTAGKSSLGLKLTIGAGITNMVLDYVYIAVFGWGIAGAAVATGCGILVPSMVGLVFFARNKKGTLHLVKPRWDGQVLIKSCTNGASEMVTELSNAITTFLYNIVMMRLAGSDGVAAMTIVLYLDFLLKSALLGFAMGVGPVFSYNYGSQDHAKIKKFFKYSLKFVSVTSACLFTFAFLFAPQLSSIFAEEGTVVYDLAVKGFKLYCFGFLFTGISIFSSALFTAFSNGSVSATISFFRTFLFIVVGLLTLPNIIGITGAWIAGPIGESIAMLVSLLFLLLFRKRYKYL